MQEYVVWFEAVGMGDVEAVGGKNASLGEMRKHLGALGIKVPNGFATTAWAYREFLRQGGLTERIASALKTLDVQDVNALKLAGATIRQWIIDAPLPTPLEAAVASAYERLEQEMGSDLAVAVRSSATAEDLPDASFAGQQETFLNVRGTGPVLTAVKHVFASLYNDRAIAYRVHQGFDHHVVALSAGVQCLVRSDSGASGVIFTLDPESGFRDVVLVTSAYGLGETVVQGAVNPDEFYLFKPNLLAGRSAIVRRNLGTKALKMILGPDTERPTAVVDVPEEQAQRYSITDQDAEQLARYALDIEAHYGRPMDIEWAKDGVDQQLYIVQARPETVKSRSIAQVIERYRLLSTGEVICEGRSIGQRIGSGRARIIKHVDAMGDLQPGEVLVADMTDPDWEPIMKKAAAIVTNRGGRTCHAAIIARELGIPAVVGTQNATQTIQEGQDVTVSCAEGDTGFIYAGRLEFERQQVHLDSMPPLPVKIMMNVGNPDRAFEFAHLPNDGVGLARIEFVINRMIGIHPRVLLAFDDMPAELQAEVARRSRAYASPVDFYVSRLTEGIATLAAAFTPKPVIVRLSDFKSNEYANLLGGERFEPHEENPMLGFRGASRYIADTFRRCFDLECQALRRVRNDMGFKNVQIMVPFVRSLQEANAVVDLLARNGLQRGEDDLRLIMMCEIPANALLADEFLAYFDGFSIGSNDLTQLTLGIDRDSGIVASSFDERDPAVKALLQMAIGCCKARGKYIGICGQGPSDYPDFAQWLLEQGIESLSLNPDSVVETWLHLAGSKAQ